MRTSKNELSFGDFFNFFEQTVLELRDTKNLRFIEVEQLPIVTPSKGGYSLKTETGEYQFDSDSFFYNWSRKYNSHDLEHYGIPQRYVSEIYSVSPEEFNNQGIRNIVLLGASPAAPWLLRDFPGIRIALIRNILQDGKKDEIPEIPGNKKIDLSKIIYFDKARDGRIYYNGKEVDIASNSDGITSIKYSSVNGDNLEFLGHFFAATGLSPNVELTASVKAENKLELSRKMMGEKGGWIANGNIPVGSLMQSYLLYMSQTRNIDNSYEPHAYHRSDFRSIFGDAFKREFSIPLSEEFFDSIDKFILYSETIDDNFYHFFQSSLKRSVNDRSLVVSDENIGRFASRYLAREYGGVFNIQYPVQSKMKFD